MMHLHAQIRRIGTLPVVLVTVVLGLSCCAGSAVPHPSSGRLIWGRLLTAGTLSGWGYVQGCPGPSPPKGVTVVGSPVHRGWRHSLRFRVSGDSVSANCPILGSAGNPNANLISPPLFRPGDDVYIGFSVYFPPNFPSICTPFVPGCFMQVAEVYGQPFRGSAPVAVQVIGNQLALGTHAYGTIWRSPTAIRRGTWEDIVLHVRFSTQRSGGFVALWLNRRQRRFGNGDYRFHEATLLPGVTWDGVHANTLDLQQYRGPHPSLGTVDLYETGAKVGTTYAAAAP
jgi:hypothetical protein